MTPSKHLAALALLAAALPGCAGIQSALAPAGPEAGRIAWLTIVLVALCTAVLLLVLVSTWLAIRGSDRVRRRLASQRVVIAGGIVLPAVVLTALLAYGLWLMQLDAAMPGNSAARIEVIGERWWWRVVYRDSTGARIETGNEVRVPVGAPVDIALTSADVIHSFWVPTLAGKVDMIPGRTTHIRLRASHAGVFRGQCAEYCGGPHALMAFDLVAMPQSEFETWLQTQSQPASPPADAHLRQGQQVFTAAGCGGCHIIRGTRADGRIGPDLTHLAGRRMLAAGTLAMTEDNLRRFIVDGQHVKPGNTMPPFRVLSEADARAVAAYLMSLQ